MEKNIKRRIHKNVGFGISLGILTVLAVSINVACAVFDSQLTAALGITKQNYTKVNYPGVDPIYNKSSFDSKEKQLEFQSKVSEQICEEGFVLLEKGNIPYASNTKISLFSESSVDFIFGGTGSGKATSDLSLKTVMNDNGFKVNDSLWNFYEKGNGKKYRRGVGSIFYGDSDDYAINECPLPVILKDNQVVSSFKEYDTAMFVFSRTGGEGNDLARGMDDYVNTKKDISSGYHKDPNLDKKRSYLEPDSIELEIIDYLNKNFKDVILVVNANNAVELGWIKDYEKINTVIQVPGNGAKGLNALPKILTGKIASSGHLVDTFAYDAFSSPAMMNMGEFEYLVNNQKINNPFGKNNFNGYYYVNYLEGIYVGYRYYETRYEDCVLNQGNANLKAEHEVSNSVNNWSYEQEVMYPFGYGASLAKFDWSNFNVIENSDEFIITITVKNISDIKGKDVVQIYGQTPYGEYEKIHNIEKASVQLLGFKKTKLLNPNEEEVLTLTISKELLKSYDYLYNKTYILSKGQYYLTAGKDAHAAINNILRKKGISSANLYPSPSELEAGNANLVDDSFIVSDVDTTTYAKDSVTNKDVTNIFDFANLNNYGESYKYLSRSDWKNTYPKTDGQVSNIRSIHSERINSTGEEIEGYSYIKNIEKDSDIYKLMTSYETLNPHINDQVEKEVKYNQDNKLELIDLRGASYEDPRWEQLISQMSKKEVERLIQNAGYRTEFVRSIYKPLTSDKDGPAGLNSIAGHFPLGITYPCAIVIAQTYNSELANAKGEAIGEDCLNNEIHGWYGPGNNIHRSPFAGRNFEYYSEDPILSSQMAASEVMGAANKGVFAYVKHFALNNQEIHREKECGLLTFSNEQAIREIYLKAFEGVIKNNKHDIKYYELKVDSNNKPILDENKKYQFQEKHVQVNSCLGVMSSFNRIGPIWAGGCYPLLTTLLKEEWGYQGAVLTDYYHDWFMNTKQAVLAGGSLMLDPEKHNFKIDKNDPYFNIKAQEAVKSSLYMVVNSNAMNGYVHGVRPTSIMPIYSFILIPIDIVLGGALLTFIILLIKNNVSKTNKKQKQHNN